jgi:hypothetical protein
VFSIEITSLCVCVLRQFSFIPVDNGGKASNSELLARYSFDSLERRKVLLGGQVLFAYMFLSPKLTELILVEFVIGEH